MIISYMTQIVDSIRKLGGKESIIKQQKLYWLKGSFLLFLSESHFLPRNDLFFAESPSSFSFAVF